MRSTHILLCFLALTRLSAQVTVTGTIQSGGLTRDYRLYLPATYSGSTAVPLVLNLHGYTSNAFEQEFYGSFRTIADTANFLVVHPNGTLDDQGNRFWNAFGTGATVDDVQFLSDLIDTLQANYNIDPNRIYSTGMSNGGFMSYSLACELGDRIAAIASVTGSMVTPKLNACNPQRPVPVMEIHGTADNTVPYNGSVLQGFVSIPTLVNAWVAKNNCNTTPIFTPVPNTNTTDGCTAEHYLYTGGINGSTVEHFKIIGGGHTWPGAAFPIGVTNQDISASREIWRFFRQYRLDLLTDATTPAQRATEWSVHPNPVRDYLILKSTGEIRSGRVRVFDAIGRSQHTVFFSDRNFIEIETASWAAGVYVLAIEQAGKIAQLRVVKEH